jgi:AraC-like DNA-binding protein
MRYFLILFLFSCSSLSTLAQSVDKLSLEGLSDEQLLLMFDEVGHDSVAAERIARIYLDRARREGDTIRMARGYDRLARSFSPETNLRYADSVIELTQNLNHISYPTIGYILKGFNYQNLGDLIHSTKSYITAYDKSKIQGNVQQQVYVLYHLIFNKAVWGDVNEALSLQRTRHGIITSPHYKDEIQKASRSTIDVELHDYYINDLISSYENFAFIFLKQRLLDSVDYYSNLALDLTSDLKYRDSVYHSNWLKELNMEKNYVAQLYDKVLKLGSELAEDENLMSDPDTASNVLFYLGMANIELGDTSLGVNQLEQSDSLHSRFSIQFQPEERNIYRKLADHYINLGDNERGIVYLDKLIKFDKRLEVNYRFFEPSMIKNLETPQLIAQKQAIINSLDKRRQAMARSAWILGAFALAGLSGLVFYYQRQRRYKQRFEALRSELEHHSSRAGKTKQQAKEISSSVIVEILGKLEQFEEARGYLDPDLNLNTVAKDFGTNAKYLSSVVNLKKGRNFSQYINTLRTEYALARIRNDRLFRRYTIKAIAMEVGFNRAESFSKAFYRRYGIYPSYFIKQLELDADVDTLIDSVETSPSSP